MIKWGISKLGYYEAINIFPLNVINHGLDYF